MRRDPSGLIADLKKQKHEHDAGQISRRERTQREYLERMAKVFDAGSLAVLKLQHEAMLQIFAAYPAAKSYLLPAQAEAFASIRFLLETKR